MTRQQRGLVLGLLSYLLWGFLSLFWKLLAGIDSYTVLSYRVLWTCLTMLAYLLLSGQGKRCKQEIRSLFSQKKLFFRMLGAAFFIALNWLVYIFAVSQGRATEASLGYYIMPLISVALSCLIFREKLGRPTLLALVLASCGLGILIIQLGYLPGISLILSFSFALYGVLKKGGGLSSDVCMLIESAFVLPFAGIYLLFFAQRSMLDFSLLENFLLIISGLVTAIPLLLFSESLKRAPLNLISFMQYLNPTIQLIFALTLMGESLKSQQIWAFALIWLAILVFLLGQIGEFFLKNLQKELEFSENL